MILQASYTGVDGSNCIVFTTLHWRTQIFSDKATILEGIMASPTYTPEKHQNRTIMQDSERVKSHHWPISRVDDITMILLCYGWYQQAIIKMSSHKTITPESVKRKSQRQRTNHCNYLLWGIFTCEIESVTAYPLPQQLLILPHCSDIKGLCMRTQRASAWLQCM